MTEGTIMSWEILDDAHKALRTAVAGVSGQDGWNQATPCERWTVAQVLQHAAGDQIGFAAAITGGPGPDEDPFAPSGTLAGDPAELAERAMRASAAAFGTVARDDEAVPTPIPPHSFPADLAVGACALDAAVHAWDIAMATGQDSPLTPELARALMPTARVIVDPVRAWGAYAEALPEIEGDDDVEALLRYLGRDPHWKA
ncbi:TIGR03086 family metal-binding protein [Nonomuraea sp. NPDC050663]|uniref:TIGR03086 family metal-binding protein n=1 Tax=Nonomuraea sp. NPDC050663 TaxID=3364370 RepID=UPI0037A115AF